MRASLAAAAIAALLSAPQARADDALTTAELQKLFPGTFMAVVHGTVKVTFTAKGNGVLIGQMPGKSDEGRWSLENGKLCIMLSNWTHGHSTCSVVVADNGWYRGEGVVFRKI
jgi:hypothetical protein